MFYSTPNGNREILSESLPGCGIKGKNRFGCYSFKIILNIAKLYPHSKILI